MTEDAPFIASEEEAFNVGMTPALFARRTPNLPAVVSERGDRTFAQLNARANQLVRALRSRGLRAGDSVALMCSNRPELVEVYAATVRAGWRVTMINWHLQVDEAAYIVADCEARAFIAEDRAAGVASAIRDRLAPEIVNLCIGVPLDGFVPYEAALEGESGEDIANPSMGIRMAYTSGTTGRPKGVRPRPGTPPQRYISTLIKVPLISGESMVLCTGPLYHAAPSTNNLVRPLHRGVGIVLMDRWDPEETLRLIERHKITHTHMVATMFHRLLALPPKVRERYDLSSLRYVLHGAAPTPVHVKHAMIAWLGPIIYEYYAGTEGAGTSITPQEWLQRPGSVGKSLTFGLRIIDDQGGELPAMQVGRVFFDVPTTGGFQYHNDPEKTAAAYLGNSFTMGDHGYIDDDGYLFLTGRTSEVIISGGVNIYPAEVDDVLLMHPDVADAATVGVPNEEFGEEVKAVVMLAPGREASADLAQSLIDFCRSKLAHFKCPRSVDFETDLPRSEAGKIQRKQIRARYWRDLGREM